MWLPVEIDTPLCRQTRTARGCAAKETIDMSVVRQLDWDHSEIELPHCYTGKLLYSAARAVSVTVTVIDAQAAARKAGLPV